MNATPRQVRIGNIMRGVAIAVLLTAYGFLMPYPQVSFKVMFLIGASLQLAIIFARKFVPPELMPQVQNACELIADGATILAFALGIFGAIGQMPESL